MKLKEVGFSESIQLVDGHWIKAWASVEGDAGDDKGEMWAMAKEQVKRQIMLETGGYNVDSNNQVIPHDDLTHLPVEQRIANIISDISACRSLEGLNGLSSYAKMVKSVNNPEITAAYDEMYLKLSK